MQEVWIMEKVSVQNLVREKFLTMGNFSHGKNFSWEFLMGNSSHENFFFLMGNLTIIIKLLTYTAPHTPLRLKEHKCT